VTLQSLRQLVVNVAKGISGVQFAARPAPIDEDALPALRVVTIGCIGAYLSAFDREIADRESSLAGSGPVLAAVGAMGEVLLRFQPEVRPDIQARLLASLPGVDWRMGDHRAGITDNCTPGGVFLGRGHQGSRVRGLNTLTDPENGSYKRVRTGRVGLATLRGQPAVRTNPPARHDEVYNPSCPSLWHASSARSGGADGDDDVVHELGQAGLGVAAVAPESLVGEVHRIKALACSPASCQRERRWELNPFRCPARRYSYVPKTRLCSCRPQGMVGHSIAPDWLVRRPVWRGAVSHYAERLVHRGDHYRALAHGRGNPFDRSGSHVTDGENAGTARSQRLRQRVG
jgi:hypothetical protein